MLCNGNGADDAINENDAAISRTTATAAIVGDGMSDNVNNNGDTTATTKSVDGEIEPPWKNNHRSKWARRKHRKKMEQLNRQGQQPTGDTNDNHARDDDNGMDNGGLSWESFDFGESPKMDKRFEENDGNISRGNQTGIPDHIMNTISTDSVTYQSYLQSEANLDDDTSARSLRTTSELSSLSPELVRRSIDALAPYVQDRRLERIDTVLSQRTRHTRFLFENPSNPSNVWACLRTLDSFGIQYVDVIVHSDSYMGKAAVNQKRGMRTAMGSAMWMTIRQFGSLEGAVKSLKEEGCLIYASDLNPSARDVRDLTWDVDFDLHDGDDGNRDDDTTTVDGINDNNNENVREQRPICIVMGNEDRGISDEMRKLADETFYLPMCGFAESFNLSVATAITLAYMSAVSGRGDDKNVSIGDVSDGDVVAPGIKGPLRPGDLDPHELQCLRLRGLLNSLAQKRMGKALLKKEGIVLPDSMFN